ncbi:hypothetical protein PX554_13360 [Sphingomonas sp. H39-1-10]|uniref:hypothetical protein n=1 Tax=Sphingomonas pollutisoli TaxID=3030829 RepID=UPI0023B9C6AF|nr:hypothetical protein [Sphingomonas pollutisoli]MDF0489125.1 hypothetical protein [Sphingomonas pollutisoli]
MHARFNIEDAEAVRLARGAIVTAAIRAAPQRQACERDAMIQGDDFAHTDPVAAT